MIPQKGQKYKRIDGARRQGAFPRRIRKYNWEYKQKEGKTNPSFVKDKNTPIAEHVLRRGRGRTSIPLDLRTRFFKPGDQRKERLLRLRQTVCAAVAQKIAEHGGGAIDAGDGQLRGKPLERVREQKCLMNVALRQRVAQRQERGILRKAAEMGEVERRIVPVQRKAAGKSPEEACLYAKPLHSGI